MRSTATGAAPRLPEPRVSPAEIARRMIDGRSGWMVAVFGRIFERTLRQDFHAVRLANRPDAAILQAPRLVVYSNHPAWWDGALFVYLAYSFFAGRRVYTPIDAEMFEKYGFLRRVGGFGVELGRAQGARLFLEACRCLFEDPTHILLVAAQAGFADPRRRPLNLGPGIAHVSDIAPDATFLPLAIEYPHWLEKQPEVLMRFGEPIVAGELAGLRPAARLQRLEAALGQTMDKLAEAAITRDAASFEILLQGKVGINPVYDLWRRVKSWVSGQSFSAGHGTPPPVAARHPPHKGEGK